MVRFLPKNMILTDGKILAKKYDSYGFLLSKILTNNLTESYSVPKRGFLPKSKQSILTNSWTPVPKVFLFFLRNPFQRKKRETKKKTEGWRPQKTDRRITPEKNRTCGVLSRHIFKKCFTRGEVAYSSIIIARYKTAPEPKIAPGEHRSTPIKLSLGKSARY